MANRSGYIYLDIIREKIKIEAKLLDEQLVELEKHSLIRLGDKELYIFKEAEVEE
jgi:DNA-binding HxlR family transcriptional regulator